MPRSWSSRILSSVSVTFTFFCACFLLNLSAPLSAQSTARDPFSVQPRDRVVKPIDDEQTMQLRGNIHPLARAQYDAGAVAADFPMERMVLTLKPSAAQQQALDTLVEAQHDPNSPYFHQWITPEQYADLYGVSQNDIALVTSWLQSHGMTVDEVPPGRRSIVFTGTAVQVEAAFHTPIHTYRISGAIHHANATEPAIPLALSAVVGGVVSLHDFRAEPAHAEAHKAQPEFTSGGSHYIGPGDFATIYNLGPQYQKAVNGSGQSIAIVGRTNIHLTDVQQFRSSFNLSVNNPQIIVNGTDPGVVSADEETEADLDVEWSGAVAPAATVKFVVSASTNSSDGVDLSAQYIVTHNVAPVMSTSFGLCEAALGSSGNSFLNGLWQQAAAQGITVLVSAGDSGAAGCDSSSATTASHGLGVNGLCSTPYSVCVGGTEFNEGSNAGLYWAQGNTSGTQASAISYIPEVVWNESSSSAGLWAGGGGVSATYTKPSWQAGPGVPADGKRDVPDVSLTAAVHDGYLIYMNGGMYVVGGTSAASPSFAGLMALVDQSTNAHQGNANSKLYPLATAQNAGGSVIFHDTTTGNNSVPGLTGYHAGAGYDLASGLGSVDANALVNHWNDATPTPDFQLSSSASSISVTKTSNASLTWTITVSGGFKAAVALSITGLPTGVTAAFTPVTLPTPGAGNSTLKLTAATTATPGTYSATVSAKSGSTTKTSALSLTVLPAPTFTLAASQSSLSISPGSQGAVTLTTAGNSTFNVAVALSVTGLPTGLTAHFSPTSITAPGSGSSTLTLSSASTMTGGSYTLTVTASGGGITQKTTLAVSIPGFTLAASPGTVSFGTGGKGTVTLTTHAVGGFASAVALSAAGVPAGVSATFTTQNISSPGSGSSALTLACTSGGVKGSSKVTVTASGGGVSHSATVTVTLTK